MGRRLVVPGTGGCTYRRADTKARIGTIVDIAKGDGDQLLCTHTPGKLAPNTTSGIRENGKAIAIEPFDEQSGPYDLFAHAQLPSYRFFNYDWRLDIRQSGQMFWDFLQSQKDQGEPWDVVCHSQGGLILLWAAKLAVRSGVKFGAYVRKVVMAGVPIYGTVNAVEGLLVGADAFVGAHVDKSVVRSWPSIYMMMPQWDVGLPLPGAQMFLNAAWDDADLLPKQGEVFDPSRHVDTALLARAREWKNERATNWLEPLRDTKGLQFIFGENRRVRAQIPHFPSLPDDSQADGKVIVRGDSLVPLDTTWTMLPNWVQRESTAFMVPCESHMLLCNERPVFDKCESFFA